MCIKKLWKFLYKGGISLSLFILMFFGSVSLVSLTQKGKVYYGNRCNSSLDKKTISFLKQEEIVSYDYELNCNTLYLELNVDDHITIENAKALIIRISTYYKSINFNVATQISLKGKDYIVFASLVENETTMSISTL